ncbi:hypothetical protein BDK51DRAFT_39096 [Blyttiomyces helicus]|uniref:Uncharacterized protein n=1 Tax=Blyttiomyces helicus TaxID=388810 RepID=A0A4V1ISI2_9FUNG|nr:hypothetical protein BDK51DRAFT_39096 [Blyttiomyces helicus]|eukprot:RKO93647.1 hypothetical protein BDK51DRAFT_39096 [Blyttiomyces helicus]
MRSRQSISSTSSDTESDHSHGSRVFEVDPPAAFVLSSSAQVHLALSPSLDSLPMLESDSEEDDADDKSTPISPAPFVLDALNYGFGIFPSLPSAAIYEANADSLPMIPYRSPPRILTHSAADLPAFSPRSTSIVSPIYSGAPCASTIASLSSFPLAGVFADCFAERLAQLQGKVLDADGNLRVDRAEDVRDMEALCSAIDTLLAVTPVAR